MEFDFSKLEGRIIEKFGTRAACAKAVGMPETYLYNRLGGRVHFSLPDVCTLCAPECLDIPLAEIGEYFFKPKVA